MNPRELFFEDLASALQQWSRYGAEALTSKEDSASWMIHPDAAMSLRNRLLAAGVTQKEVEHVLSEVLYAFAHSVLSIIDGATAMSEAVRIRLTTPGGVSIGEGLHELFLRYLKDSDRVP